MIVFSDAGGRRARSRPTGERLERIGVYRREQRPWLPHVTVRRFRERPRLEPAATRTGCGPCRPMPLSTLLVLRPGGARYDALETWVGNLGGRSMKDGSRASTRHGAGTDRAPVRQGRRDEDERPGAGRRSAPSRRGRLSLDVALGVGGLPRGRIVEVFGPESSGKTTLVYHVIAEAQRRGGICAFIDAEHAMDPAYAKRIGVNIDELLVSQPDTGEQALEICELLVRSGALAVVAIDSVAALTPKAEIEGEMGDTHVGLQARLMSPGAAQARRHAQPHRHDLPLHEPAPREDRRHVRQPRDDDRRARARFYASVRLDIRRIETLKEGVEAIGNRVRVKVVKNKVAPPFKQAEFDIIYGDGISWEGTVLETGLERKVVQKSGSYFSFGDERLGQGRQNATAFLKEHPDVVQAILQEIQAAAPEGQVISARLLPQQAATAETAEKTEKPERRSERKRRQRPRRARSRWRNAIQSSSRRSRCAGATIRAGRSTSGSARPASTTTARAEAIETSSGSGTSTTGGSPAPGPSALAARGFGDAGIRFDLEAHGVDGEAVGEAVAALPPEAERAGALVARLGRTAKTGAPLARKGFAADRVESALGDSLTEGA